MSFRELPSVDAVVRRLDTDLPPPLAIELVRAALDDTRRAIRQGASPDAMTVVHDSVRQMESARYRRMINATGVLLHTNLGRAPLHEAALDAARRAAQGYGNLEFDLRTGRRGGRGSYLSQLLTTLTGAEAALVVNNNAAALLLTLAALASGRSVPVSRGELIEIGGSYRLPELMNASGARLVEIGTTNRTRTSDYARVVSEAALLLKVHPSNYRVVGFSEDAPSHELAALAGNAGLSFVYDVGSGLLDTEVPWIEGPPPPWLAGEPGIKQEVAAAVDLVLFSGDKLIGGPQSGIVVGRADLIRRLADHPLARALRVDGSTIAALTTTLELYMTGRGREIPFWEMATRTAASLTERIEEVLSKTQVPGLIVDGTSLLGAGSVPGLAIPTPVLTLGVPADAAWTRLLAASPPILARREGGAVLIDLRTVDPTDDAHLIATLAAEPTWR